MLLHELLTHVFEVDLLLFVVFSFLLTKFSFLLFSLFADFCSVVINGGVLVTFWGVSGTHVRESSSDENSSFESLSEIPSDELYPSLSNLNTSLSSFSNSFTASALV